ncbi:MAG: ABC transporter permease [Lachnospiraceae bacterium]|nr:ABC transporter permease [Lachnospiraceae bacterium]
MKKNVKKYILGISSIVFIIILWKVASSTGIFGRVDKSTSELMLPPPEKVFSELISMIKSGYLLEHILTSFERVMVGFLLATVIGIPLGVLMGINESIKFFFYPIFRIVAPIPGVAWVPLAILWFGLGNDAAIFIIAISSITPIVINVLQGVESVDKNLDDVMTILNGGFGSRIRYMIIPSIIPYLVTGFKLGLGYAWRVVIAAEMVGVPGGLGYVLNLGRSTAKTEITLITIITLAILLIIMEQCLFRPLEKLTDNWKRK